MARRVDVILIDILSAIEGIEHALQGMTYEQFVKDWVVKHAVQRGMEIISEASRHIPDEMLARRPDIHWRGVRAIGNLLRHEYHNVSDQIVWKIADEDLPALKAAMESMLKALKP